MIKLPFKPDYFPVLLLPVYWIYFLCFYIGYLPIYVLIVLFSPWKSDKRAYAFYMKKTSAEKRSLQYKKDADAAKEAKDKLDMSDPFDVRKAAVEDKFRKKTAKIDAKRQKIDGKASLRVGKVLDGIEKERAKEADRKAKEEALRKAVADKSSDKAPSEAGSDGGKGGDGNA